VITYVRQYNDRPSLQDYDRIEQAHLLHAPSEAATPPDRSVGVRDDQVSEERSDRASNDPACVMFAVLQSTEAI
jgi:hypothetical protein